MSRRTELYLFAGLIVLLAAILYFRMPGRGSGVPGVFGAEMKFKPLDVEEPQLRLQLLDRIQKTEYAGSRRNIFVAAPPPAPKPLWPSGKVPAAAVPAPPPPVQVPAQFFGYARQGRGKQVAFFTSGEDVLIVPEGDTFLGRFRLVHIGSDSAEVEEMSTGRHATVAMLLGPDQGAN
jgi:hypothetical protein